MGDGTMRRQTDPDTAFDLQDRVHEPTGTPVRIASTSCRMVTDEAFMAELQQNGLVVLETGLTAVEPDFPVMQYAVVQKAGLLLTAIEEPDLEDVADILLSDLLSLNLTDFSQSVNGTNRQEQSTGLLHCYWFNSPFRLHQ